MQRRDASHAHNAHLPCAGLAVLLQALLGPSGAGKSTLMDILAQRKSTGNLSGFLLANGRPTTSSFIRKTAYVPQVGTDMSWEWRRNSSPWRNTPSCVG
jgi:ABC-type transport system involved in cytochrome bd biosynthesis fused ATPase/permease subunit